MANLTIHLDDEMHRVAKIYAAEKGTSLSQIFREHIQRLSSGSIEQTESSVLKKYSESQISANDAMNALKINCLEDLFRLTLASELTLPHVSRSAAKEMARSFLAFLGPISIKSVSKRDTF